MTRDTATTDQQQSKEAHKPEGAPRNTPPDSEVWRELERVGQSRTMRRAGRLVQLLNFLVETTLRGESRYLKESTIGVAVFGRAPDYDPKADNIVRSQAWRLRAKLRDYYISEGASDSVVISIPKGKYVPLFSFSAVFATRDDKLPDRPFRTMK